MRTKICTECKIDKSLTEFYKDIQKRDNLCCRCKDCQSIRQKKYQLINKKKIAEYMKKYQQTHRKQQKESSIRHKVKIQKYRDSHKKEKSKYNKEYGKTHRKEINLYRLQKRKKDINYKIACYIRTRIIIALKRNFKSASTKKLLGCSIEFLKQYLQKQFLPKMSWDNYGIKGWHIDHIRPCASFDLSKPSKQRKCFNYTNLQPLWAKNNFKKGINFQK